MVTLRLYVESSSLEDATAIESAYITAFGELCELKTRIKEPYWKMANHYHLLFDCALGERDPIDFIQDAKDLIGANPGTRMMDNIIWADTVDSTFKIPGTVWANIEADDR